jgi:hypothetical protein
MRYGDRKEILRELKNICFKEIGYSNHNKFCNFGGFILCGISPVPIFFKIRPQKHNFYKTSFMFYNAQEAIIFSQSNCTFPFRENFFVTLIYSVLTEVTYSSP